jgi:hypothetical protein
MGPQGQLADLGASLMDFLFMTIAKKSAVTVDIFDVRAENSWDLHG